MTTFALDGIISYLPVGVIILMATAFIVANLVLTSIIGPSAQGAVKGFR